MLRARTAKASVPRGVSVITSYLARFVPVTRTSPRKSARSISVVGSVIGRPFTSRTDVFQSKVVGPLLLTAIPFLVSAIFMPRTARVAPGGHVYHVLNRSIANTRMFAKVADHEAFEQVMVEAQARHPIRILSHYVVSKHWQFVVWPEKDGQLTDFFRWFAHTHAMRWRVSHRTVGHGPLYQGRFKSFPVQRDKHFLTLLRYVERSPLSVGLVENAQQWRRAACGRECTAIKRSRLCYHLGQ
jgi:REP element-mobilizing transposase RayT